MKKILTKRKSRSGKNNIFEALTGAGVHLLLFLNISIKNDVQFGSFTVF
jgi:hypothetical protein